jgi:uncharacterized coiled-coil protein SlyX
VIVTDETLAPVHKHIADLEQRVARQSTLIEKLSEHGNDATEAKRTLHHLESALRVAREHLSILLSARTRWYSAETLCAEPAG